MKTSLRLLALFVFALVQSLPAFGQVPSRFKRSFFDPSTALQAGAQLGSRVAVEGRYAVVGAPLDDMGGENSGLVKVFDSMSGSLLFVLRSPEVSGSSFGSAVAISGSRVAVGDPGAAIGESDARGVVYVFDLARRHPTAPAATFPNPTLDEDTDFGYSVGISGSRVVVGEYVNDPMTNIGRAYVYDLNRPNSTMPVTTLESIAGAITDHTNTTVAISGSRVVVGVTLDDSGDDGGDPGSGRSYVYDLSSSTPTVPLASFREPGPGEDDSFGSAVAIAGTRVVIGNSQHRMILGQDTFRSQIGIAYVYDLTRNDPTIPAATLLNPIPRSHDGFGSSVAISGAHVVVGAPNDHVEPNGTITPAGIACVFDLNSATPMVPVRTLSNPSPAERDSFGFALAISDARVFIGAPGDDTAAPDAGSAYLYNYSSATPFVALTSPGPATGARFGNSLAISGTLMVVGAPNDDTGGEGVGRVYVYDFRSAARTIPRFILNSPTLVAGERFGTAVSISGTRVVVGVPWGQEPKSFGGNRVLFRRTGGKAYVYDLASAAPTVPIAVLRNPDDRISAGFGSSVSIFGTRIVIGSPRNYTRGSGSVVLGTVYAYDLSGGNPTVPVVIINNPGSIYTHEFGKSVAISGTRFVIGVPGAGTATTGYVGSARVYNLASADPNIAEVIIDNPSPDNGDSFGESVAISAARVIVGTPGDRPDSSRSGSAFVFSLNSDTPAVPVAILNNPNREYSGFGESVAISGTRMVVGASYGRTGAVHGGKAYVYDLASRILGWPIARLQNPRPAEGDGFGTSVAIDGATVAAGTPGDDTAGLDNGAAYVFGIPPLRNFRFDQSSDQRR